MNFELLLRELTKKPIGGKKISSKTAIFGTSKTRTGSYDYTRYCWSRAYLYKLLQEFGRQFVDVPYTTIILNQNSTSKSHTLKTKGEMLVVSFGTYTGGNTQIDGVDYDTRTPIQKNISKIVFQPFEGIKYTLIFYTLDYNTQLPPPSIIQINNKYYFKRGDDIIKQGKVFKSDKTVAIIKVLKDIQVSFE